MCHSIRSHLYLSTLLRSWSICLRGGPSLLIVIPGKAWLGLLIIIGLSHFPRQLFLKIEVKGGRLVKKWEFGQTKKNSLYQFFKTRICAFMTYGQYPPKISSNLNFVIQDSNTRGHCVKASSNPWISDNKSQVGTTFRQKLTIVNKSTYSSFEKLTYKFFFIWANSHFLTK